MKLKAIIVDIDGTLAHMAGRSPYDYSLVDTDTIDKTIRDILDRYCNTHKIIVVSGRKDECYQVTLQWLHDNHVPFDYLHMRKESDNREDSIIKREIYDNNIKAEHEVDFVLDDRNRVVKMWREIGLKCLQVAEGDF